MLQICKMYTSVYSSHSLPISSETRAVGVCIYPLALEPVFDLMASFGFEYNFMMFWYRLVASNNSRRCRGNHFLRTVFIFLKHENSFVDLIQNKLLKLVGFCFRCMSTTSY